MNATKLATLSTNKIERACTLHAEKALEYMAQGRTQMHDLHCNLLDQCAAVLRVRLGLKQVKRKYSAKDVIALLS